MKYSLLLLPFLASSAFAQDDLWKSLAKGDRVQITFRSGNMILGNLTGKPADPRVPPSAIDYSAVSEVTIDVSLEYPGLNGTMTIPKKEIKEIRKLQNLDAATMKRIQEEMARIKKSAELDEAARKASEKERDAAAAKKREELDKKDAEEKEDKDAGAKALKNFEDLKKGKELLQRFPPDKYGEQTLKDVIEMGLRKQPIPRDIQEFADQETQRLWKMARDAQKEQEKKAAEKAPEKK